MYMYIVHNIITIVFQVSAHGHLNLITCNFCPHGRLPRIEIPYVRIIIAENFYRLVHVYSEHFIEKSFVEC